MSFLWSFYKISSFLYQALQVPTLLISLSLSLSLSLFPLLGERGEEKDTGFADRFGGFVSTFFLRSNFIFFVQVWLSR